MPFEIVRNDIANMVVDAIVNTTNSEPVIGYGVDSSIHNKAGSELLKARRTFNHIKIGDAVVTEGFRLDAKYVIHTVAPIWKDGNYSEEQLLASCYAKSLQLAKTYQCESIAFPLIATGTYGFPKQLALQIAIREISAFLLENEMQVYLVVYDKDSFVLSSKLFQSISSYIDENYIDSHQMKTDNEVLSRFRYIEEMRKQHLVPKNTTIHAKALEATTDSFAEREFSLTGQSLEMVLEHLEEGFSDTLLKLIDSTGKKDSEIYKKANIDRKLFSKIRNNKNYKPSKNTALAFAFALELNLNETKKFISKAGYTLSHSSKFDVIIEYFIVHKMYDVIVLNEVLFSFSQPLIGG